MAMVHWEWILLRTAASGGSHRIARRGTSATSAPTGVTSSGTDSTGTIATWAPTSQSKPPPKLSDEIGRDYVFAFWSIRGGTTAGQPVGSSIIPNRGGFSVPVGEDNNSRATAYYVWDFGAGPGDNAVLIDAFDQDEGFIPDDFVNVFPGDGLAHTDPKGLYWKANDGFINSEQDLTGTQTITAFNPSGRQFVDWIEVDALTFPAENGPVVNGTDAIVMKSCVLVAFAVYANVPRRPIGPVGRYDIFDPWWWVKTRGGLTPPGPPDPWGPMWMQHFVAALALAESAGRVLPQLRADVLKVAEQQLRAATNSIRQEIRRSQDRKPRRRPRR